VKGLSVVALLLPGLIGSTVAAAAEVEQTLDQVKVFSTGMVLDMTFNDPNRSSNYTEVLAAGPLVTCKLTADGGFFCLEGQAVRAWPNGLQSAENYVLFTCGVQARLAVTSCTGLTVDDTGRIWLAGKNKAKTHSLVKVEACTGGTNSFSAGDGKTYCATTRYTGRPTLVDIDVVRNSSGVVEGIVGLEERMTAVYFAADGGATNSPKEVVIGSGNDWSLSTKPKEELQGVTVVAPEVTPAGTRYALVATSLGRVLAKKLLLDGTSDTAFPVRSSGGVNCAIPVGAATKFSLRSSTTSDVVYLTDKYCRTAVALKPAASGARFILARAQERKVLDVVNGEAVYSAYMDVPILTTGSNAPEGLTPAVGLGFNIGTCTGGEDEGCQPVYGFKLWGVDGITDSGATLFKVVDLPDCRYIPDACKALLGVTDLIAAGVVVDPDGIGHPAAQYLNVTPLLDEDVTSLYDNSGVPPNGLPALLISPSFRAQAEGGHIFQAFFVKPEPGLTFTGTFEGEFDVAALAGRENGCVPAGTTLADLLYWDTVTKASEVHVNVQRFGKYPAEPGTTAHTDVLLNTGCGSSRTSTFGLSLIAYNMEPAPDTYDGFTVVENNDAVFARMVDRLNDDIGQVLLTLACNLTDGATDQAPLSDADCLTLKAAWESADQKLEGCVSATYQPKQSASNQNCQAFLEHFGQFKAALEPVVSNGAYDVANRRGELDTRVQVFEHVYATRFVPSIPRGGFCRERYESTDGDEGCLYPLN
jgi:hypothetical protein